MKQKHFASKALGCALVLLALMGIGATAGYARTFADGEKVEPLTSSNPLADAVPKYQYKVKKVGSYKGDDSSLSIVEDVVHIKKDKTHQIVGNDGKLILDGELFDWSEYWGNGVYAVRISDGDVSATGLVNNKGEELLPCEAAMLRTFTRDKEDARFVEVVYSNGETKKEDEAFFFVSSDESRELMTTQPSKGDTLYKGYARIFDLQQGKFVEGVQIDDANAVKEIADLGESFIIQTEDGTTMYDGDGKTLWSKEDGVSAYQKCFVWGDNGKRQVVDAKGDARYTTSNHLNSITSSSAWWAGDYLQEDVDSLKKIIDLDGNRAIPGFYYFVDQAANGLFLVKERESDKTYKIKNAKDEVIVEGEGLSLRAVTPGYNAYDNTRNKTDGCGIVKGGKVIWKGKWTSECEYYAIAEQNGKVLTLNDEKFSLTLDSVFGIKPGLAVGRGPDSVTYGLYDVFTGKQLIADDYDEIKYAGGNVWAYQNGTWDIYDVELEEM